MPWHLSRSVGSPDAKPKRASGGGRRAAPIAMTGPTDLNALEITGLGGTTACSYRFGKRETTSALDCDHL